jgi:Skp family chaperone for outer membrane proteins
MRLMKNLMLLTALFVLAGCSTIKYNTLEKIGIHKRDLLVDNVEDTRDAQQDAQEQFQDALERFGTIVAIEETDLKKAYDKLKDEYEDSVDAAEEVSEQIDEVEEVAADLFAEWRDENKLYTDKVLRRDSENKLRDTEARYKEMLKSMQDAEASMQPVLASLRDNVLYLKHNLNAQAVGSLRTSFNELEGDIGILLERMNQSIARSNEFIDQLN